MTAGYAYTSPGGNFAANNLAWCSEADQALMAQHGALWIADGPAAVLDAGYDYSYWDAARTDWPRRSRFLSFSVDGGPTLTYDGTAGGYYLDGGASQFGEFPFDGQDIGANGLCTWWAVARRKTGYVAGNGSSILDLFGNSSTAGGRIAYDASGNYIAYVYSGANQRTCSINAHGESSVGAGDATGSIFELIVHSVDPVNGYRLAVRSRYGAIADNTAPMIDSAGFSGQRAITVGYTQSTSSWIGGAQVKACGFIPGAAYTSAQIDTLYASLKALAAMKGFVF